MGIEKKSKFPVVKKIAKLSGVLALLYYISLCEFSTAQVREIRRRDKNKCQYPGCKNKTKYKVEVHHIATQGYSVRVNNMRPDTPFNAVCLCEEHHVGHPKKDQAKSKESKRRGGRAVYRESEAGMHWDPIHPDSYLLHLVLVGKFDQLSPKLKKQIDADFPDLYAYYAEANREKKAGTLNYKTMYSQTMRKWRSDKLDSKEIYWNSRYDRYLHIAAINNTLKAIKRGWRFPLRMLGGNVNKNNRGGYAWDNLIAISIETYILGLNRREMIQIMKKMKDTRNESRIVFYTEIYSPAVKHFENRTDVAKILNQYFNFLGEERAHSLILELDRSRRGKKAYKVLMDRLYKPAMNFHNGSAR